MTPATLLAPGVKRRMKSLVRRSPGVVRLMGVSPSTMTFCYFVAEDYDAAAELADRGLFVRIRRMS